MSDVNYSHQYKIFNPRLARPVTIIGVGAVGGWVTMLLAKAGVTDITIIDHDFVASDNVPASIYHPDDVGKYKVDALAEHVLRATGTILKVRPEKYQGEKLLRTTVISCVDEMTVRDLIWNAVKGSVSVELFCDTRMNAAFIDVLSIRPLNREECADYEMLNFPDSEADPQTCGSHGIAYATTRAAGIVVANVTNLWTSGRQAKWRHTERCDTLEMIH